MALDVSEYSSMAHGAKGEFVQAVQEPANTVQQVAISGVSAQSAAFNRNTKVIRLHTTENCRIAFGANPAAASTSMRFAAGATEYFGVVPGQKVAVISST